MKIDIPLIASLSVTFIGCIIGWLIGRKIRGINKYRELVQFIAPKGTKKMLKSYAALKGFKNESQLINNLIYTELEKDKKIIDEFNNKK